MYFRQVIDYDCELFLKASFLLVHNGFYYHLIGNLNINSNNIKLLIISVTLPDLFPSERCIIIFSSVYHEKSPTAGEPYIHESFYSFAGQPKTYVEQLV